MLTACKFKIYNLRSLDLHFTVKIVSLKKKEDFLNHLLYKLYKIISIILGILEKLQNWVMELGHPILWSYQGSVLIPLLGIILLVGLFI